MSQESVNRILFSTRLTNGVIDATCFQNIEKLSEHSQLSLEEKNAFILADLNSINEFLSSAAIRRDNSTEDIKSSI